MKSFLPITLFLFLVSGLFAQRPELRSYRTQAKESAGITQGILQHPLEGPVCLYRGEEVAHQSHIEPPPAFRREAIDFRAEGTDCGDIIVDYIGFEDFPEAQAAFEYAVDLWRSQVTSPVPIRVEADFSELAFGVLGAAGPGSIWANFPGVDAGVWYPDALADKLAGFDLNPDAADIFASFNTTSPWYFGLDGAPPPGTFDFVTVVLHELAHGLGFIGSGRVPGNGSQGVYGFGDFPLVYDTYVQNSSGIGLDDIAPPGTPSPGLADYLRSNDLFVNAPKAVAANGGNLAAIFAPEDFLPGSSYSHWDEETFPPTTPQSLMTPFLTFQEAIHDPGTITIGMFEDHGWMPTVDCQADDPDYEGEPCEITEITRDPIIPAPFCVEDEGLGAPGTHAIWVRVGGITPQNQPKDPEGYMATVDGVPYPIFAFGYDVFDGEQYFYVGIAGIPSEGQTDLSVEITLEEGCSGLAPEFYDAPNCDPSVCAINDITFDPFFPPEPVCDFGGEIGPPGTHYLYLRVAGITEQNAPPDPGAYQVLIGGIEYGIFESGFDFDAQGQYLYLGVGGIPGDGQTNLSVEVILSEDCSRFEEDFYDAPNCAPADCEITEITLDPLFPDPFCLDLGSSTQPGEYGIYLRVGGITPQNLPPDQEAFVARVDGTEYPIFDTGFDFYEGETYFYMGISGLPGAGQEDLSVEIVLEEGCSGVAPDLFDAPNCFLSPFQLVDAQFNDVLGPLEEGAVLDQAFLPLRINFLADPSFFGAEEIDISSVAFDLTGPLNFSSLEQQAPFTLFGNDGSFFRGRYLPKGEYQLSAEAFQGGQSLGQGAVSFTVVGPEPVLSGLVIVDAGTDQDVGPLNDGDVFELAELPVHWNVRAEPGSGDVESVLFDLRGAEIFMAKENTPPFALFGNDDGDYFGEALPPGTYTLTATPFYRRNGLGEPGTPFVVTFEITNGMLNLRDEQSAPAMPIWTAFPNPAAGPVTVVLPERSPGESLSLWLTDLAGRTVVQPQEVSDDLQTFTYDPVALGLASGTYLLHARGERNALPSLRIIWQR